MAYTRLGKARGKRIDGGYVVGPAHPLRRWRRGLITAAGAFAVGWFALSGFRIDPNDNRVHLVGTLHNPGPVSRAHGYFEANCAACHTGNEHKGFFRGVRDEACLACHDGSIHNENQKIATTQPEVSLTTHTLAVANSMHPHGAHSAACATCHVEHKGEPALAAVNDQHCTQCHEAIGKAVAPTTQPTTPSVTAFSVAGHPPFGAFLKQDGNGRRDPTRLRFNHSLERHQQACTTCHELESPVNSASGQPLGPVTALPDRRFLKPIQFDKHCASCHKMAATPTTDKMKVGEVEVELDSEFQLGRDSSGKQVDIAHRDLAALHRAMEQQAQRFEQMAAITGFDGEDEEHAVEKEVWLQNVVPELAQSLLKNPLLLEELNANYAQALRAAFKGTAEQTMDVSQFGLRYGAYLAFVLCGTCHALDGDLPFENPSALLTIEPVGIPAGARRWYPKGSFDHFAHRMMNCTDCHPQALTSHLTADVLVPDLQSCVSCHEAGAALAPANCVTCHTYHDRSKERPPIGPLAAPTTQPVTAAK